MSPKQIKELEVEEILEHERVTREPQYPLILGAYYDDENGVDIFEATGMKPHDKIVKPCWCGRNHG